jgi:predicted neutral ceramidase superfamily lipid hydrolase
MITIGAASFVTGIHLYTIQVSIYVTIHKYNFTTANIITGPVVSSTTAIAQEHNLTPGYITRFMLYLLATYNKITVIPAK